jgi:hypothetical protein
MAGPIPLDAPVMRATLSLSDLHRRAAPDRGSTRQRQQVREIRGRAKPRQELDGIHIMPLRHASRAFDLNGAGVVEHHQFQLLPASALEVEVDHTVSDSEPAEIQPSTKLARRRGTGQPGREKALLGNQPFVPNLDYYRSGPHCEGQHQFGSIPNVVFRYRICCTIGWDGTRSWGKSPADKP